MQGEGVLHQHDDARSVHSHGLHEAEDPESQLTQFTARELTALERAIVSCERCPRLVAYRQRIARTKKREFADWTYWGRPVPAFGDPAARLLIVGLAPAAHGANRTGRMFTGDSSGDWLYAALHRHGFASQSQSRSRDDGLTLTGCWITAVVRCAPPDNKPTRQELTRCRPYLERELGLLASVKVVLALGRVAWEGWLRASGWWDRLPSAKRPPFVHGGETTLPDGRVLLVSYHPSRQNTNTRKLTREMWDGIFRRARELVERGERGEK